MKFLIGVVVGALCLNCSFSVEMCSLEVTVQGLRVVGLRAAPAGAGAAAGGGEAGREDGSSWDSLVLVLVEGSPPPPALQPYVERALRLDHSTDRTVSVVESEVAPGGRLVLSGVGALTPYDDVRALSEAVAAGVRRAVRAGSQRPVVVLSEHPRWPRAPLATLLAALEVLYVPLETREDYPEQMPKVSALGAWAWTPAVQDALPALLEDAEALEAGRWLARDVGGGDPERMTPLRVAEHLVAAFAGSAVAVRIVDDPAELQTRYPLLAAVNRAADVVPRHRACVVFLEYTPPNYTETLMVVGKGVTYDTGGADVKTGGSMAGMSRDKCGAAAAAGLVMTASIKRAPVKILAALGMVRNSIGADGYLADELLRSRAGAGVRVGNTDAEGRMVMADLLTEMRELAPSERNPFLYTIATLTGHASRAAGSCTVAMDNHAARARGHAQRLAGAGEALGDVFEISTIRREDLAAHRGRAPPDALWQAAPGGSTLQPRGHQGPGAFMLMVSGLDSGDIPYSHLDIAGSAGDIPAPPTAAPLVAMAAAHGIVASE